MENNNKLTVEYIYRWLSSEPTGCGNVQSHIKGLVPYMQKKTVKKRLIEMIIENGNGVAFTAFVSHIRGVLFYDELERILASAEGKASLSAAVLAYKSKVYPEEVVERIENEKAEKALGLRDYDLRDVEELFTVKREEGGYVLSNYKGSEEIVEIPGRISGVPVVSIERIALNNHSIKEAYIGEGVVSIRDRAFKNSSLCAVYLPSTLREIGYQAFLGCAGLSAIDLPENLEKIGEGAFFGCSAIRALTVPETLSEIANGAFAGCRRLHDLRNLSSLPLVKGQQSNGMIAFYACEVRREKEGRFVEKDGFEFYEYDGRAYLTDCLLDRGIVDPQRVYKSYSDDTLVFSGTRDALQTVVLPESFEGLEYELAPSAFCGHDMIMEVKIPSFIKKIPACCFDGCSCLYQIDLPDGVEEIGWGAFRAALVYKITLPDALRCIGDHAFYFSGAFEVRFGKGLKQIGRGAFSSSNALKSVVLPEGLETIGAWAFSHCFDLKTVVLPRELKAIGARAFKGCNRLTEIDLPDGIEKIEDECFFECKHIERISIPASVREIGKNNFPHRSLKTVSFRGTREEWDRIRIGPDNKYLLYAQIATEAF